MSRQPLTHGDVAELSEHELLTVREVAHLFRVRPRTVTLWLQGGQLAGFKPGGGHWRVRVQEVRRLQAERA